MKSLYLNSRQALGNLTNIDGSSGNGSRDPDGDSSTTSEIGAAEICSDPKPQTVSDLLEESNDSIEFEPLPKSDEQALRTSNPVRKSGLTSDVIADQVQAFLEKGGKIEHLPSEAANPSKFETVLVPKPGKDRRFDPGWAVKPPKYGQRLGQNMNIHAPDPAFVRSTKKGNIKTAEIFGALAMGSMKKHEQDIMIYYNTQDKASRSAAWAWTLCRIVDLVLSEKWDTRKRGTLERMTNTLLDNLIYPEKYIDKSERSWATALGLKSHNAWSSRWRARYNSMMFELREIVSKGERTLAEQL